MLNIFQYASVQFSHWVVLDNLRPHEPQQARPPCPLTTPGVHPNPCPLSLCAIQPSHPLSSPSPPALNPSQHQGLFKWVNSLHEVAKVLEFQLQQDCLPMNIQDWSPLGWTGWISLQSKGHCSLLQHHSSKTSILQHSAFFIVQLSHPYMTIGKTIALTRRPLWQSNVSAF